MLKTQKRGQITDYFGMGPDRGDGLGPVALCVCKHGKRWPEGDLFEGNGGKACRECVLEAVAEREARDASGQ